MLLQVNDSCSRLTNRCPTHISAMLLQEESDSLHDPLLEADQSDTEPFFSPAVTDQTEPETEPDTEPELGLDAANDSSSSNSSSSSAVGAAIANSSGVSLVADGKGGLTWQECLQCAEFWCLLLVFL
jgi:hypothetical protein